MTRNCFEIGTIQAFLDGELGAEKSESVARHVAACDDCAILLANAEEESAFAFSALEQEFNTLVPTQRLWTKINDEIGREKKTFWAGIFAFVLRPSTAAFASLIFVAAVLVALVSLKPDAPTNLVAENSSIKTKVIVQDSKTNLPDIQSLPTTPQISEEENLPAADYTTNRNEIRSVKANFVKEETPAPKPRPQIITEKEQPAADNAVKPLAGEDSYLKTIATLTETVKNRKDETLNPSARFAFERDLAVTDDAIEKMRDEIKKNPNDEAAKQILRASYQNKIDLLSSVVEKNELMASLK